MTELSGLIDESDVQGEWKESWGKTVVGFWLEQLGGCDAFH